MKKTLIAISLLGSMCWSSAYADTVLGVYVGGHAWNMDTEGGFSNTTSLTNFDFDSETKGSFYATLEHPIPLVPNIKIRQTEMDSGGNVTLTSSFTFGDQLFTSQSDLVTDVDVSNTDFILYYELFDNDLVSFDFGLNGKYVDGSLFVQDASDATISALEEFSGVVPMIYSRLELGLPLTGWGIYAEGSFLSIDDHTLSDYQAAITYEFVDNLAVDMTLEVGYRAVVLELEDLDDIYSDLEFSGVYAGLEIHF